MKRKVLSIAIMAFASVVVWSQPAVVSSPLRVMESESGLLSPQWSPDGRYIAAAGDGYHGIYVYNLTDKSIRQISSDAGAGYRMQWTDDAARIVGRTSVIADGKLMHEVKVWNVADGVATTLLAPTRGLKGFPMWNGNDELSVRIADERRALGIKSTLEAIPAETAYSILVEDPAGAASRIESLKEYAGTVIINPSLSPDGMKVAFQVPGRGMMVMNAADGSDLVGLGKGLNPTWTPDGKWVVYTITADDGMRITSSKVCAVNVTTRVICVLLNNALFIPMTPSINRQGTSMVFENEADRSIYTVDIKL